MLFMLKKHYIMPLDVFSLSLLSVAPRSKGNALAFHSQKEMFEKIEETFRVCATCDRKPAQLPDPKALKRCGK